MAKVIFFSIPAYGHTNPTLPVVKELVKNGEEVVYYSSKEFKEKVISMGAIYKEYEIIKDDAYKNKASKNLALLYFYMIETTYKIIDNLVSEVRAISPDYIIHDAICPWGRYVATICNIPAITSVPTFAFSNKVVDLGKTFNFFRQSGLTGIKYILAARDIQNKMEEKYGVKPRNFVDTMMNEEQLNIVYTSKLLQPNSGSFDLEKYKFVGPSLAERTNDPDTTDYSTLKRPLIYVSMGTVWKDSLKVEEIIDSLLDLNCTLVISGVCDDESYYKLDNVIIKNHVNQIEVLKYCDVFFTHGGMNSVNESLYWGVPLCIHPFQVEQTEVANRIVDVKCGIRIKNMSPKNIRKAVLSLLSDKKYKDNCKIYSNSFKEAGGYIKAVEYILENTKKH
jgi:MGT family glycosyltransferase